MPIEINGKKMIQVEELKPIVDANGILDGTSGGLILGNPHSNGGIKVIRQYKNERLYEIIAEFEGWEYLLTPKATAIEFKLLEKINSDKKNSIEKPFNDYAISKNIDVLDTNYPHDNMKGISKIIILGEHSQFIINKHSTKRHLEELNEINKKYSR